MKEKKYMKVMEILHIILKNKILYTVLINTYINSQQYHKFLQFKFYTSNTEFFIYRTKNIIIVYFLVLYYTFDKVLHYLVYSDVFGALKCLNLLNY